MQHPGLWLVLGAPLLLVVAAIYSRRHPGLRPRPVARLLAAASWAAVALAASAAIAVAIVGHLSTPLVGALGLGVSLRLDALAASMLLMVSLLGVVITRFSATYLDGNPRQGDFLGRMALTIACVELLVISGNLAAFLATWIATSLSLHGLLTFDTSRVGAVVAARKKFVVARLGDAALLGAFAILYSQAGTGELGPIFDFLSDGGGGASLGGAAVLLALAALLKAAQFPTHGWLVDVVETPTPVSALLHAGILNAGPFLAMRFAWLLSHSTTAPTLLVLVGGFTALFASTVLLTQPSVKAALAYSSAAHMGFSLLLSGLGLYSAALLHLIGHSFYKAHAFLSSGSNIDAARASRVAVPPRLHSPGRILTSLVIALGICGGVAFLLGYPLAEKPGQTALGAILIMGLVQLLAPVVDSRASRAGFVATITVAVAVTLAFYGLEDHAHSWLGQVFPRMDASAAPVIAAAVLVLLAFGASLLAHVSGATARVAWLRSVQVHWRNGFYANALFNRLVGANRL